MRRALYLTAAITLAVTATPAMAGDMLYPGGSMLSEGAVGKPLWSIQAQCAGLYGATSATLSEQGDTAGATDAKRIAVGFHNDAVERLVQDRKVTKDVARESVARVVLSGREEGLQQIRDGGGLGPQSRWNVARSVCLDVDDVYAKLR